MKSIIRNKVPKTKMYRLTSDLADGTILLRRESICMRGLQCQ